MAATVPEKKLVGYLPQDVPPVGSMISLGLQQVLTMFPATVLVAILTKFDVGVTLLASGLGTIIALLVSRRQIPMYYGSSFSYISVVITAMNLYAKDCFADPATTYCAEGVRIVQVGIIGTAVVEILVGLLIMRVGKDALDRGAAARHHRLCGDRDRYRTGRLGAEQRQRQLADRHCHAVGDGGLLGVPAGQRPAGHAAHLVRRDLSATSWPRCWAQSTSMRSPRPSGFECPRITLPGV